MIILMGMPGSGKGTQGQMLADRHSFHLISMGELVRLYVTGERRKQMMNGKLLDDTEIIHILDRVLSAIDDSEECILDGFPRTIPQAEWLFKQIDAGRFNLTKVIHLETSRDVVIKRMFGRGRIDDNDNVIHERLNEYEHLTHPLVRWYKEHGIEIADVNAERSVELVNDDLEALLGLKSQNA